MAEQTPTTCTDPLAEADVERDRAEAIQSEHYFGHFTNPVVLGMLTAVQIMGGESDG